jgi:lysozyme family protein
MAGVAKYYTPSHLANYQQKFDTAQIKSNWQKLTDKWLNRMVANMPVYMQVQNATGVPWYFVGLVHMRESGMNFNRHLHNGDPLTGRTIQVPRGRPIAPPANGKAYTFAESAIDALKGMNYHKWKDWSIPGILHLLEVYNGTGYIARRVTNPYLWSGTQHYITGKFVRDGVYSATAIDEQLGAGTLLKAFLNGYTPDGKKKILNPVGGYWNMFTNSFSFFLFGK